MIAVSRAEFDELVTAALADVPDEFRVHVENVVIEVSDRPSEELCAENDVPADILGLYVGIPLEDQTVGPASPQLDRIHLFRDNLTAMCSSRDELVEEIRITLLHEIGHHLGMDEDQLEELGYG